jgi:mannose-1-phosphate guanylyltransferase
MEKAQNVIVADGDFGWDDVGSWTALYKHIPQDEMETQFSQINSSMLMPRKTLCLMPERKIKLW